MMAMKSQPSKFTVIYPPIIKQHLKFIAAKYYSLICEAIETQLQFDPDAEKRNRKPLKRPVGFGARWEIRFGPNNRFRVFYRIDYEHRQVIVLAIGEKRGNRLLVGEEEIEI